MAPAGTANADVCFRKPRRPTRRWFRPSPSTCCELIRHSFSTSVRRAIRADLRLAGAAASCDAVTQEFRDVGIAVYFAGVEIALGINRHLVRPVELREAAPTAAN